MVKMITLRPCEERDMPAVCAIELECFSSPWTHGALLSELYNADTYFIVAELGVDTAGYAITRIAPPEAELYKIATAPRFQRLKIAESLLRDSIKKVEKNASSLFLEVRESNIPARKLYEKMGFTELHKRRDYFTNPIEDARVLALALNPQNLT